MPHSRPMKMHKAESGSRVSSQSRYTGKICALAMMINSRVADPKVERAPEAEFTNLYSFHTPVVPTNLQPHL